MVISGTLKYVDTGALPAVWGAGNFLALQFDDWPADADAVLVGLEPSVSSGLVDVKDDPDKNGAFKITDPDEQKFVTKVVKDGKALVNYYTLDLTLETSQ